MNKSITLGPNTAPTTTFEKFKYNGRSQLERGENNDSLVTFAYNSLSDVTKETLKGHITTSVYDGEHNMLSLTYPNGRTINYVPDELNRLREVIDGPNTIASYSYIGRRIARADYGNGTRTIYEYDGMQEKPNPPGDFGVKRIIKTTHVRITDGNEIDVRTYKWDKVNNKKQRKDIRLGGPQERLGPLQALFRQQCCSTAARNGIWRV